jgi:parvulin-like peptidyl-prolyl isomerase
MVSKFTTLSLMGLIAILISACGVNPTAAVTTPPQGATSTPFQPSATFTPLPPTPTSEPLAATVNGAGISLAEYNAEMERLQASLKETGKTLQPAEQQKQIMDELVNETLLAAAAFKDGYKLDDSDLQKRIDDLTSQAGGADRLAEWMKNNFYTPTSLKIALRRNAAAAWERDQITAKAPTKADQVHLRQMLLLDQATADRYFNQLKAGADFATLAYVVDPDTGGDLGWAPKGYLLVPEIEQAAFGLEVGKYSPIIKTAYGYQIIYLIERDSQHPLSTDARGMIQQQLMDSWLKEQSSQAKIQIFVSQP